MVQYMQFVHQGCMKVLKLIAKVECETTNQHSQNGFLDYLKILMVFIVHCLWSFKTEARPSSLKYTYIMRTCQVF